MKITAKDAEALADALETLADIEERSGIELIGVTGSSLTLPTGGEIRLGRLPANADNRAEYVAEIDER